MNLFEILAFILTFAAAGGYINQRFVGLPSTIGHMAFALFVSILTVLLNDFHIVNLAPVRDVVHGINFSDILLHGMLAFLLFAGALHINVSDLKHYKYTVTILATLGVALATLITATMTWFLAGVLGMKLPFIYALIFGALIAPTDPIAVLGILKELGISKSLYTKIGGESLFNDGVGVVVFVSLLEVAAGNKFELQNFVIQFLWESMGGILLGSMLGWITYKLLCSIDAYKVEILLTLALVSGGYALAENIHVSAPLSMVAAGLIIGNKARAQGMTPESRQRIDIFWELLDEILNAVLFLLIGLEIIIVQWTQTMMYMSLLTVIIVLFARAVSVGIPLWAINLRRNFDRGTIPLMIWGGLRGGLSIAMALSLPPIEEKTTILTMTYTVVLFTIFVQGLTFKKVAAYVTLPVSERVKIKL